MAARGGALRRLFSESCLGALVYGGRAYILLFVRMGRRSFAITNVLGISGGLVMRAAEGVLKFVALAFRNDRIGRGQSRSLGFVAGLEKGLPFLVAGNAWQTTRTYL